MKRLYWLSPRVDPWCSAILGQVSAGDTGQRQQQQLAGAAERDAVHRPPLQSPR